MMTTTWMCRTAMASCVVLVIGALAGTARAGQHTLVASLRGGQEVPPVASTAIGSGRFIVDTDARTVTYHISFTGLSSAESAAHIHGPANPGVNAGVKHNLGTGNPKVGVWNYDPADEADILAGRMYVNVHSASFPGGEIRGQINDFAMSMDGAQENPVVPTTGGGWGTFNIDVCNNKLHYHIVVESLGAPETVAHIHGLALPGANAGVLHGLPAGSVKTGTWDYDESVEEVLLNGMAYVNVHTSAFPGGEIRGQIVNCVVPMDGSQEVPPNASTAAGTAYIAFDSLTDTMGYYIYYQGLSSAESAAHIHGYSPPGVNSGVVHGLSAGSPKKGSWTYGAANAANVLDGLTYINVHTASFGGGEIRGQIIPPHDVTCPTLGDLNGDGVVDVSDLLLLLGAWGPCGAGACPGDFNGDGAVDVSDLLALLANWG